MRHFVSFHLMLHVAAGQCCLPGIGQRSGSRRVDMRLSEDTKQCVISLMAPQKYLRFLQAFQGAFIVDRKLVGASQLCVIPSQ